MSTIFIAGLENIPQFIVVYYEIFLFRTTITFIQAAFPIITLCMINKTVGPITGEVVCETFSRQRDY